MWEFRRDFQRVWEGWEAGFMAFHAFHTLSFPWPAFSPGRCSILQLHRPMSRTRKELLVVIVVDKCIGDFASFQN